MTITSAPSPAATPTSTARSRPTREEFAVLTAHLRRAEAGDKEAMALVRKAFDEVPALWQTMGNMALQAEAGLIHTAAGDNLALREAMARTAKAMREDIGGTNPTPLEKLLVDRIVVNWLALSYAEATYHQSMGKLGRDWADFHLRRIDRAQHRYLAAIRTLAQVRRLLTPAMQINIAEKQINLAG